MDTESIQLISPKLFPCCNDLQSSSTSPATGTQVFPTAYAGHTEKVQLVKMLRPVVKSQLWVSSPRNIKMHRNPNPGPFLSIPHQAVLHMYTIWPTGFHAHALQDSCSFCGPGCWTSWILKRIHPGSIPVPSFPDWKPYFFKIKIVPSINGAFTK